MSSCVGCSQKAYEILNYNFYLTSLLNFKHTSVKLNCIDMTTELKCTEIVNFITTRYEVIVPGCGHIDDFMKMIDFIRILYFIPGHRENLLNHNMCKK